MNDVAAERDHPPGPEPVGSNPIALLRYLSAFNSDPIGFVKNRFDTYGDVYFTVSRGDPLFVTRHPDHIHQVLVQKASAFQKRGGDIPFLGEGLVTSNGETWRRQRRLIQPAFHRSEIETYAEIFVEHTERHIQNWQVGDVIELDKEMMSLTLGIVCKALFDHEVEGEVAKVADAVQAGQEEIQDPLPDWIPTPAKRRRKKALRALDQILDTMIEERRPNAESGNDLLSRMLRSVDDEGTMSKQRLRDELVTMFVAGHETTSLALTWTWFLLSQHPEIEKALELELAQLDGRSPQFSDLKDLGHTARIIDEGMRLYPPAPVIPRIVVEPVEIGGYHLQPKDEIVMWILHMHRDPRWFESPMAFDPDRFLPDSPKIKHPHAYIPFGAGSRTCIGRHFARFEAQIILGIIAQRFRLQRIDDDPVGMRPRITLGPDRPIRMRLVAPKA